ncbi:MAG: hypothetical protein JNL30_18545 [Rubrivivax sp.]|nr:hypothetical protein [Rubrivivax sp.]
MQLVRLQDSTRFEPLPAGVHVASDGEGVAFHDLLCGTEGALDNHRLQLVEISGGYCAGRHRHNFDQVRVVLEGQFGFGPGLVQGAGSVGYFCEGTWYEQEGAGRSLTLLLQLGGPSGSGYLSRRQLAEGLAALRGKGEFSDSRFTWYDANGMRYQKDRYEAVWEHVNGRPMQYARPQYATPVLMEPERFGWVPATGREGVWLRTLGRFSDRGLALTQLKIAPGMSLELPRGEQVLLLVCVQGGGTIEGRTYARLTSLRVEPGEAPRLSAARESLFYGFELPRFD